MRTRFAARWIAVTPETVVRDAVLTVTDGRVDSVGPAAGVSIDHDFGESLITPGFVNAHTHLDLTGAAGKTPPKLPFPDWLRSVIEFRRSETIEQVESSIRVGIQRSQAAGITLLGDISSAGDSATAIANWHSGLKARFNQPRENDQTQFGPDGESDTQASGVDSKSRPCRPEFGDENRSGSMKARIFRELIGNAEVRTTAALDAADDWLRRFPVGGGVRPALSPHSPYSFAYAGLSAVASHQLPVAVHFAESAEELPLLSNHEGPFVSFLKSVGAWHPDRLAPSLAAVAGEFTDVPSLLLIHANYWSNEVTIPANATIVFCPRTHAAFGHSPHPFRRLLECGVRVALGTDSLASNPDLSVLAEARFVARQHPDLAPSTVLDMITRRGAEALLFPQCGTLEPGKAADFVVLDLSRDTSDPLTTLLREDIPIRAVLCDGALASGSLPA